MFKSKSNIILSLVGFSVVSVFLLGILSPYVVSNYSDNWNDEFKKQEVEIAEMVQTIISQNEKELENRSAEIKTEIIENNPTSVNDFLEIVSLEKKENLCVNLFYSNQLVGWNKKQIFNADEALKLLKMWGNEGAFFYETSLIIYLATVSEVDSVIIVTAIPIQKKYFLKNSYYQNLSLIDLIKNKFDASISIIFSNKNLANNFLPIKNNNDIAIGSIKIKEISRNADVEKLRNSISLVQSIFAIIAISFLLFWFSYKIISKNKIFKTIYFVISLVTIRVAFSLLSIGEYLGFSDLINPTYFSSTFALGLTKSPMELFLTIITVLIISLKVFFVFSKAIDFSYLNKTLKLALSFVFIFLLILLYNGFTSTIKSIIFDSSILYFKDASLFASYETTFMYLNILLIGLSVILFTIVFVSALLKLNDNFVKNNKFFLFALLFLISSVLILLNEFLYNKSSILLSMFFLLLAFGVSYSWLYFKVNYFTKIITLLLSSSILSISFLNFFNSELEVKSLKIIANELTRSNIGSYEYYVNDALNKVKKDDSLSEKIRFQNTNLDAEAFLLWTKTLLASEVQGSAINIIDKNKNLIGSFGYRFSKPYTWEWGEVIDSTTREQRVSLFGDNSASKTISAITTVNSGKEVIGYVEVVAAYDAYEIVAKNRDKLIAYENKFEKLSINIDLLKIYEFRNNKLSSYFTNIFLTKNEKETIKNSLLTKEKDAWVDIKINDENNIFYIKKIEDENGVKIVAVGLSNKDITWNLFDFFKVFFIHSIMILFGIFIAVVTNYKNWKNIQMSFKAKILISLLLVSILPLILLASYFKSISDSKNSNAINYKLGKRADNVEEYINTYISSSLLNFDSIFDKATKDLGINYSIYENENLIYSSEGTYYRIDLLPMILNPNAFLEINKFGMQEIILKERVDNYNYNSLYHKYNIAGKEYIIKVSDLFNNYQLPMSGIELNVFLFGTYSLAIILITILSTILANQISSPIEKLTKATRSVSHGDMDIQLQNVKSGEVKELIDGFNLMVRELKKNQIELAEVERESAWREMAKQVAHEIKNPLTPMKLAVQHLVAAHNDRSEKYDSIFEKVTTTVINQIDILKNIASEFSSFAKMPSIKLENIVILEIISETVNLFIEEDCVIIVQSTDDGVVIKSDKEQFQRMIINLIRNSIQANATDISINIAKNKTSVELLIEDNGSGIKSEVLSNIFEDNFTTKKDGMGLGLAMTRRFLNKTNGKISVEDTSPNGTLIKITIDA